MNKQEREQYFKKIVLADDYEEIEYARGTVQKEDLPMLLGFYWELKLWEQRRAWVELVQDQYIDGIEKQMLDFLRAPYYPENYLDMIELDKAVALMFMGEEYDQFMTYYNDRNLLYQDVEKVLKAHNLSIAIDPRQLKEDEAKEAEVGGRSDDEDKIVYNENDSPVQNLMDGALSGQFTQVKEALKRGADINTMVTAGTYTGCNILLLAMSGAHWELAKFLIEAGADYKWKRQDKKNPHLGQTALWWAAGRNAIDMMHYLLDKGADINAADSHGSTPLCTAASSGNAEAIALLLEKGADLHGMISDKRKAINLAANSGDVKSVELLLEAGMDPDYRGDSGYTALMLASEETKQGMVKALLNAGADVNAKHAGTSWYTNLKGMTPLAFAVSRGRLKICKILIEAEADVNYTVPERGNKPAQKIIEMATAGKYAKDIRALLLENGAKP